MSEERFEVINARWQGKGEAVAFEDTQTNQVYFAENQEECERIVDLLNEQQSTIRKLQDLCGESDGENAKLRIENKRLQEEIKLLKPTNIEQYEQIVQLQQENEQLQAQLREKEQDEQLYANEILELREANKEFIQFKELGGDY